MKRKYQLSLILVNILLLVCTSLYAQQCKDYPDQHPYDEQNCQDVEPLEWVNFPQASVLPNSPTPISISGGKAPFTWIVTGNNFYLDSTGKAKKVESASSNATIYAVNACGTATVTVTDGCSTVNGQVASTNGVWTRVYYSTMGVDGDDQGHGAYPGGCPAVFDAVSPSDSYGSDTFEDQTAAWRVRQTFHRRENYQYALRYSEEEIMETCEALGNLCYNKDPLQLSGSCFTFEDIVDCEDSGIYGGNNLPYTLGIHKSVYLYSSNPWESWYLRAGCSTISGTRIWKWQCQN